MRTGGLRPALSPISFDTPGAHIIRPDTLVRWHRAGFLTYWRWKSRNRGGRPQIDVELRTLILEMSNNNPLWGAPRIHGELLKLGFEVAQVHDQAPRTARSELVDVSPQPCAGDRGHGSVCGSDSGLQSALRFVIVRLDRRELVWIGVTTSPTAEWIARQITEAFPWGSAPHYLVRDRDRVFGSPVKHRLQAMGIRDKPIAPRSRGRTALPND
jgi:hypothetical protein